MPGAGAGREGRSFELEGVGAWEGAEKGLCSRTRGSVARGCQTGGGVKTHTMMTHWASLYE